ncbi:MAG: transglycosylase domain-containing protein [Tissierellia bacterium]|nr:transglycosylase domain-containing protein [Tissierellia bacterium]
MSKKIASIIGKVILVIFLVFILLMSVFSGVVGGSILEVMRKTPHIDAENIKHEMAQNSVIVDQDGNEIDTVETSEYREAVDIDQMPDSLKNAFVAVEDERFYKHKGFDIISLLGSVVENIKAGSIVRGGSTLTQQLARNTYLSNDQTYERKIKEIYIALEIEQNLSKDEILEAYLNRVFLGQNSFGVQAASQTYFSKDVSELTLAESAAMAGIVKSPTSYALFNTMKKSEVTDQKVLGEFTISGEKYAAVYNGEPFDREVYVLSKMLENGYITEKEYKEAKAEDVASAIKPAQRVNEDFSNYFVDLMQRQVVAKLQAIYNISENAAWEKLYYGGLKITTTMDQTMQDRLEDVYSNFSELLNGNTQGYSNAPMLDLSYDDYGNIINSNWDILYYDKDNILDSNNDIYLTKDEGYYNDNGDFVINSGKFVLESTNLFIKDYYNLDENNSNLRTHRVGAIEFTGNDSVTADDDGNIIIKKDYLDKHDDMIIDNDSYYSFNKNYYDIDLTGLIQPQSSTVVIDQTTGHIKAIVGGRDQEGFRVLDRAIDLPRQPGSSIKPIATYTPALDNGYNLATGIDDVPFEVLDDGQVWPNNIYGYFRGFTTLRDSIKYSVNTNAVKVLDDIGIPKSKEYLENFGIINKDNPEYDHFVSKKENSNQNDENLAALGLGAMTSGLTTKDMAAAYAALANGGVYNEPLSFSKIEDSKGEVIFDDKSVITHEVTSPQTAYQMTSALQTSAEYYERISIPGIDFAAKTGTTDHKTDFWCVGYTPYYTVGTWIGADNQNIKLTGDSTDAAYIWGEINRSILQDNESKSFEEPDGIIHAEVDTISGKKPTDASRADPRGTVIDEIFSKDNQPKSDDDMHVWVSVDSRNNLLASNKTPSNLIVSRSFVDRKGSYDPAKFGYIYPQDWDYEVPKTYSDLGAEIKKEEDKDKKKKDKDDKEDSEKEKTESENKNEEPNNNQDQQQNNN